MKCYVKDYPRPQFVRNNWENLNGTWDFGFDDDNCGEREKWFENFKGDKKIQVPFTYETEMSGIQDESRHDNIWYRRTVQVDGSRLERKPIHGELTSPIDPKPGCRFASRCERACPECTGSDLPLREVSPGHFVACRLYE